MTGFSKADQVGKRPKATRATKVVPVSPLAEQEAVIERGLASFVEVGNALVTIRDDKLYRESHPSFEAYLDERWPEVSRRRAYQLIDAALVSTVVHIDSERVARELVPIKDDPAAVREVWSGVVERTEGKPTAAVVRQAVRDWMDDGTRVVESASAGMSDATRARLTPERMRQQGELGRLVRDLSRLPDPTTYAREHDDLPAVVIADVESAHAWLTDFLTEWRMPRE